MYLSDPTAHDERYDVIVVGAGAVGITLAVSLSRAGKAVLLLDSGAETPGDAASLNAATVDGRKHDGILHGRGRVIGGTTTLWGGQLAEFIPYDFNARSIRTDSAWPIGFEQVKPYYSKAAQLLDLDPQFSSDDTLRSHLKWKLSTNETECEIFFTRWLREANLARYFDTDLRDGKRLFVAPSCHVTDLLCEHDESIISGVRVRRPDLRTHEFKAGAVVLACGTIEISRLLLLIRLKQPQLSWALNPHIGKYFQDHLDMTIGNVIIEDERLFRDHFDNVLLHGLKYQPKVRLTQRCMERHEVLAVAGSIAFDSSQDIELLRIALRSLRRGSVDLSYWKAFRVLLKQFRVLAPLAWRYLRHRRVAGIATRGIRVIAHCEQRPMITSTIGLDSDRQDMFGDPVARLHWVVDTELQWRTFRQFAISLDRFMRENLGARLSVRSDLLSGEESLSESYDSYHQCGGARMANSQESGVVNPDCRVFGTNNLYVAGAAVFPSSSYANPTYTALALALRLAEHLESATSV